MSGFTLKQGVTFELCCVVQTVNGASVDLTGCAMQSQIRDSLGGLIAVLTCVPSDVPGAVNLTFNGSTDRWGVGRYFCDLLIRDGAGVIVATETFGISVQPPVTQMISVGGGLS
ncbi:hypothetical protein [Gluconobacter sp.]|uniref:hypothetical protein n=1 Tax=Gluconobacter sp. TaxID=1876758 RepID=UPI0039EA1C53